jgi:hypothetical protein
MRAARKLGLKLLHFAAESKRNLSLIQIRFFYFVGAKRGPHFARVFASVWPVPPQRIAQHPVENFHSCARHADCAIDSVAHSRPTPPDAIPLRRAQMKIFS